MVENPIHSNDAEASVDAQEIMEVTIRLVAADALRNIPTRDLHALNLAIGLKSDEALEEWCAKKEWGSQLHQLFEARAERHYEVYEAIKVAISRYIVHLTTEVITD